MLWNETEMTYQVVSKDLRFKLYWVIIWTVVLFGCYKLGHSQNRKNRDEDVWEQSREEWSDTRIRQSLNKADSLFVLVHVICICLSYLYLLYYVSIAVLTLDAGLLARSQYPEGPTTGHLDTGFSWFPCVYKRMLRWFPSFQVATTCFSCSPPDLNFLVTFFSYLFTCKITTATGWQPNCS